MTAALMTLTPVLAQTTAPGAPTTQPAPWWAQMLQSPLILIMLLLVVMMIMTSRSKRRQERERTDMLSSMKRGDRVQTIGGVLGTIVDVEADKVRLKVDESVNAKIWFTRSAIHRVIREDAKAEAATK